MELAISDILNLDSLRTAKIIAGKSGINRFIGRVATIEKPFSDHLEYSRNAAKEGDLYLSKLFVFQNDRQKLRDEIRFMVDSGSAGLVIHKENEKLIDAEMRRLADDNMLPIIAIDNHCGLAELTYTITSMIVENKLSSINEGYLLHILRGNIDKGEIARTLRRINHNFKSSITAVYAITPQSVDIVPLKLSGNDWVQRFQKGVLSFLTTAEGETEKMNEKIKAFLSLVRAAAPNCRVGISEAHCDLGDAREAILESIYANAFCEMYALKTAYFSSLGIYKLLVRLKDEKCLRGFRDEIFNPIIAYEKENNTELFQILKLYLEYGGNYKKCPTSFLYTKRRRDTA